MSWPTQCTSSVLATSHLTVGRSWLLNQQSPHQLFHHLRPYPKAWQYKLCMRPAAQHDGGSVQRLDSASSSKQPEAIVGVVPAGTPAGVTAPALPGLLTELRQGTFWQQCSQVLPTIPWGPAQLVQVMLSTLTLAVVTLFAVSQLASADAQPSNQQYTAWLHLAQNSGLLLACITVLWFSLRGCQVRSKGMFNLQMHSSWVVTTLTLCGVLFPLADPVLYNLWKVLPEMVTGQATEQAAIVRWLQDSAAASDFTSLAFHFSASCAIGPLWEEIFWRGFFLASLTKVLPLPVCVLASSSGFALLHMNPANLIPIFTLSCACDLLYLRSASLAPGLMLHMGWNAYQCIMIAWFAKDSFV